MKRSIISATLFAAALAATSVAGVARANPTIENNGVLANRDGRTLYTFTKDSAGKSNCSGGCIAAWPAFTVANPALAGGDFTIVTRDDGAQQWAFKGQPLYFFAGDQKPGDVNGDKQGGVWFVIPGAQKARTSAAPANTQSTYGY
ncbi:MAG: hypothetical protein H7125_01180 [Proteobacteria bacterium]|nr:hypothetical protein [Burkholderiales bacterium]